jgi:hypothetical protein
MREAPETKMNAENNGRKDWYGSVRRRVSQPLRSKRNPACRVQPEEVRDFPCGGSRQGVSLARTPAMIRNRPSRYRLVERYVVHDSCVSLADRMASILPPEAEYVVLDLDRTVHLGVTIGERLGWEITVDPACTEQPDEPEFPSPLFSVHSPLRTVQSLTRGLRYWGAPGLLYAGTVRLGDRWTAWHRFLMLTLGPGYVERVQSLLRTVLMSSAAGYTPAQLETFCERAWRRWENRLVVDGAVVDAIRDHCPRLRAILLSSASTAPTVAHASGKLGVDGFVSSGVDLYAEGETEIYSAPVGLPRALGRRRPRFFSRPGAVVHNAAVNKVNLLHVHYPEVFAPGTVSVGITDNNYGEDRTWPDHFTHVVALNSRHPFSPFVASSSPCASIQMVDALPARMSATEKSLAWHGKLRAGAYDRGALSVHLGPGPLERIEAAVAQLRAARERAGQAVDASCRAGLIAVGTALSEAVDRYNSASARQRSAIAREMARLTRRARRMRGRLARAGRECARIQHEIERLHNEAARFIVSRES